jgi:hypothetical protein
MQAHSKRYQPVAQPPHAFASPVPETAVRCQRQGGPAAGTARLHAVYGFPSPGSGRPPGRSDPVARLALLQCGQHMGFAAHELLHGHRGLAGLGVVAKAGYGRIKPGPVHCRR